MILTRTKHNLHNFSFFIHTSIETLHFNVRNHTKILVYPQKSLLIFSIYTDKISQYVWCRTFEKNIMEKSFQQKRLQR